MRKFSNFIKYGSLAFVLAFIAFTILGAIVNYFVPSYEIGIILTGALGCATGTGIVNGIFAAVRL